VFHQGIFAHGAIVAGLAVKTIGLALILDFGGSKADMPIFNGLPLRYLRPLFMVYRFAP
jgi:hypothetical protein